MWDPDWAPGTRECLRCKAFKAHCEFRWPERVCHQICSACWRGLLDIQKQRRIDRGQVRQAKRRCLKCRVSFLAEDITARKLCAACDILFPRRRSPLCDSGKICSKCKIAKPLPEFWRHTSAPGGVQSKCKACFASERESHAAAFPVKPASFKCRRCKGEKTAEYFGRVAGPRSRDQVCIECRMEIRTAIALSHERILREGDGRARRKVAIQRRSDGTLRDRAIPALFGSAKVCPYCELPMPSRQKTLDHLEPVSRGGLHSIFNVLVCCRLCNSKKGSRPLGEWLLTLPDNIRNRCAAIIESVTTGCHWMPGSVVTADHQEIAA